MKNLLIRCTSLKLTRLLFLWIILVLILSTLIPHPLFSVPDSPLFLLPSALFFLHLLACTLLRIHRKKSWKNLRAAGPDLLHLGILLLIAALFLSDRLAVETAHNLKIGDRVEDGAGGEFTLVEADILTDAEGHLLRQYIVLEQAGTLQTVETNRPLKKGSLRITLLDLSYRPIFIGSLSPDNASTAEPVRLLPEQFLETPEGLLQFTGIIENNDRWQVRIKYGESYHLLYPGESLGNLRYHSIDLEKNARILSRRDPLHLLYPAGFLLITAGLLILLLRLLPHLRSRRPR